jgi:hypothetical protein
MTLGPVRARADNFDVTQWVVSAGASVSGGPSDFTTVTNPFQDSHSISLTAPPATASAAYSFAWNDAFGTFHADTAQTAGGNPNLLVHSGGDIRIQPNTDLEIQINAVYDYQLAAGDRVAQLLVGIVNMTAGGVVWSELELAQPITGDPASGMFEVHHTLSLPASPVATYSLKYDFMLRSFSGSPSAISTGSGSATFTITPEPASGIGLLAFALLASRHRHRRH